ncbi:MAG TPA: DUF1902 domain-containing protein [Microvirga sp.]|nr:DUF1902 domain-containing protein [Microvirga sp.]
MSDEVQVVEIAGQTVAIAYDPEAGVWYVQGSTVPGLTGEAASASDLIEELEVTVRTLSLP